MDFKVGDFIEFINLPIEDTQRHFRLVTNLKAKSFSGMEGIKLLYLLRDGSGYCIGKPEEYIPATPTIGLIINAKIQLDKALKNKEIDNLTYIEIYAKLKNDALLLAI